MLTKMMQNILGDYAKYITRLDNGQIRIKVPNDLNNPSIEDSITVDLDNNEILTLVSLATRKKQYTVARSADEMTIITEGDKEFDINKWAQLALGEIKHK